MSDPHDTPAIDSLFDEVEKLRRAAELLDKLHTALGPYYAFMGMVEGAVLDSSFREQEEVQKIWGKVNDHFGFDDSE